MWKKTLIIEIDGDSHFEEGAKEYDQRREIFLHEQGFTVLRFLNSETVCDIDIVLQKIEQPLGYTNEE